MGLNPIQFVVVPKFWAITLTMPILSMLSVAAGIFGGFIVSIFYADFAPALFWRKVEQNLLLEDFLAGFIKSVVFSWLIIWIGSYYGFRVKGGAEEVGKETTAAVVTTIFVIIIADALFSFIL
jgi:phospholipid/cholesterol/gamma-HCH transport system permease protein